jgi:hypothetical protein
MKSEKIDNIKSILTALEIKVLKIRLGIKDGDNNE